MNGLLKLFSILLIALKTSAVISEHSSFDYSWASCNVNNGLIHLPNGCHRLLLCVENAFPIENAKIGKRFWPEEIFDNEKGMFAECDKVMEGKGWHGLIVAKDEYGKITLESNLGIGDVVDIEQINRMPNYTEIDLAKVVFGMLMDEFQGAMPSPAFLADFDGVATQLLASAISCGQNGTGLCKSKCLFDPVAWHQEHLDENCTEIAFSAAGVSKFVLNISASPYEIACRDYEQKLGIGMPKPPDYEDNPMKRYVNACMAVPTEKCQKHVEFFACYKSITKWNETNAIAELCQVHLEDVDVAGFSVQICIQWDQIEQKLIVESFFDWSFSNYGFNTTRHFPILLETIMETKKTTPIFFIEFGKTQKQSAIREKADGEEIMHEEWDIGTDGIGTVLEDIAPEMIVDTWAKVIHFVPPSDDVQMRVYFQTEEPKYSKRITAQTKVPPSHNKPKMSNTAVPCDDYREDCEEVKQLLEKIEALQNCEMANHTLADHANESLFEIQQWEPRPSEVEISAESPSHSLACDGDVICTKAKLQEEYNKLKKACGIESVDGQRHRQKRQFLPDMGLSDGAWDHFIYPLIKIRINKEKLDDYAKWEEAARVGAELIMEKTCVKFEFVEKASDAVEGIVIACGHSFIGKWFGWQYLGLAMNKAQCLQKYNMSVVAAHELLHALGLLHEQSRSDAQNFIIWRDSNTHRFERPHDVTENLDFDYDFGSVMHYGGGGYHDYRLYNRITKPRFYQQTIGQRGRLSFKDVALINRIYCKVSCDDYYNKCKNGGYLYPKECSKCLCPDGYGGPICKSLEENENCADLSGSARELVADQMARVLKPKIGCTGAHGSACRCHWRITPIEGKVARIQVKSLNANFFECSLNCSNAYVEVKYRDDKRAQGAKLCCADAFIYQSDYKNWIEAKNPYSDIIISLHIPSTLALDREEELFEGLPAHLDDTLGLPGDRPPFELTYEAGDAKLMQSSKCVHPENLFEAKRNPGSTVKCAHDNGIDCSCHGDVDCLSDPKWGRPAYWTCPLVHINGLPVQGIKGYYNNSADSRHNWTTVQIDCYMAEGTSKGFWGFRETGATDVIRVDEILCLGFEGAPIKPPIDFKSLGDDKSWHNGMEEGTQRWHNGNGTEEGTQRWHNGNGTEEGTQRWHNGTEEGTQRWHNGNGTEEGTQRWHNGNGTEEGTQRWHNGTEEGTQRWHNGTEKGTQSWHYGNGTIFVVMTGNP